MGRSKLLEQNPNEHEENYSLCSVDRDRNEELVMLITPKTTYRSIGKAWSQNHVS
jgi:hypothetical protein